MLFRSKTSGSTSYNNTLSTATVDASSYCLLGWQTIAGSVSTVTTLRRNGVSIATTNSPANEDTLDTPILVRIAAGEWSGSLWDVFGGNFAEIIIYNAALSNTDRAAVESYLMTKWSIS